MSPTGIDNMNLGADEREPAGCATAGCGCIFGFVLMIVIVMFAGVFIGWIS